MRWRNPRKSGNVEDRRGMRVPMKAVGGGIGGLILLIIVVLLGGDPVPAAGAQKPLVEQERTPQKSVERSWEYGHYMCPSTRGSTLSTCHKWAFDVFETPKLARISADRR